MYIQIMELEEIIRQAKEEAGVVEEEQRMRLITRRLSVEMAKQNMLWANKLTGEVYRAGGAASLSDTKAVKKER